MFRVLDDILQRGFFRYAILELQQAGFLQQEQAAALVRRVVRHADLRAVLEVFQVLDLLGVDAHRLDVDAAGAHELAILMLRDEVIEIRFMLEIVRIEFLIVEREVRLHIVVELDNLQLNPLFLEHGLDLLEDLGMRHGRSAHLQRLGARAGAARTT